MQQKGSVRNLFSICRTPPTTIIPPESPSPPTELPTTIIPPESPSPPTEPATTVQPPGSPTPPTQAPPVPDPTPPRIKSMLVFNYTINRSKIILSCSDNNNRARNSTARYL